MSKMDNHGTGAKYSRERRVKLAAWARAAKDPRRSKPSHAADSQLRSCPHCGLGLTARLRTAGTVHVRRNRRPEICGWTP